MDKKTSRIAPRVTEDMKRRLEALAAAKQCKPSWLATEILREGIERLEKDQADKQTNQPK